MCKLRRKLEKSGLARSHIQTVWGQGYVLRDDEMDQAPSLMPQQASA